MLIRVGIEHNIEARTLAWALDFPGCFAYGADEAEALLQLPYNLLQFDYWVRLHTDQPWFELGNMDFHIDESFETFEVPFKQEPYIVNAFFKDDLRPLTVEETEQALQVFTWQHQELLAGIEFADPAQLDLIKEGEHWSILGILRHLACAEVWYLQVLGIEAQPPNEELSAVEKIEYSYQLVLEKLPKLTESEVVTKFSEESWTARKFVRRLLWHRRVHIDHIKKLLGVSVK